MVEKEETAASERGKAQEEEEGACVADASAA